MNMDRMTENEIMLAELERIIRAEKAKPDGERDEQLIDDCIREMAEIKGIRAEYSEEEIAAITGQLIRDAEQQKAERKKRIHRIAGIAAAFVIVVGASACAFNPGLINWVATVFRLPVGSVIEDSSVKYIYQGKTIIFNNIDDLISSELPEVYYPAVLPEGIWITEIRVVDVGNANMFCFIFNDDNVSYTIQTNYQEKEIDITDYTKVQIDNSLTFYVHLAGSYYIAQNNGDNILYTLESDDIDVLHSIIDGIRKAEK